MFSKKQYFPAFSLNRFLLHPISYLQIITNYRFSFLHGIFLLTCIHLLFTWFFWKFCWNLPNFMIMCKQLLMSLGCFVMFAIFLGCFAFFLFFLYDYNGWLGFRQSFVKKWNLCRETRTFFKSRLTSVWWFYIMVGNRSDHTKLTTLYDIPAEERVKPLRRLAGGSDQNSAIGDKNL